MLDTLTQRLAKVVKTMRGQARITEENSKEMLREVRLALLEADVALPVVRELTNRIKEKALGEEVVGSLNPGQVLVSIVQRELTAVIGGDLPEKEREINLACTPPAIILLAGLQGAGKTTTAGKLARWLIRNQKKKVLTVSADVYRCLLYTSTRASPLSSRRCRMPARRLRTIPSPRCRLTSALSVSSRKTAL